MVHDELSAPWGTYLTGLLASAERPFRYRNGVYRLLGVADGSDAGIAFLPPLPPGAFRYRTDRSQPDPRHTAAPRHTEPEPFTEPLSLEIPGVTALDSRTRQVRGGGENERVQGSQEAAGVARRRAPDALRREPWTTARAEESSETAATARLALLLTAGPRPRELAPSGETFGKNKLGAGDAAPGTVEGVEEAATARLDAPRASGKGQAVARGTASDGGTAPTTIDVSPPPALARNETSQRPVTAHSSSLGTGLACEGLKSLAGERILEPVGSAWPHHREGLKSLATQSRPMGRRRTRGDGSGSEQSSWVGETEPRDDEAARPGSEPMRVVAGIAKGSEDAATARLDVTRRMSPDRGMPPTLRPGPDVVTPRVSSRSGIGNVDRLRRAVADLEARRQAPGGEPPPPASCELVFPEHARAGEHGAEDDAGVEPETAIPPGSRSLRSSSTMRSRHFRILR